MGKGPNSQTTRVEGDEAEPLLGALKDGDCRAILTATGEDSLSAAELSEACDLPLSTTYRKVDMLAEAGLLEEQIRLSTSGKHTSEYRRRVEDIRLSIGGESGLELEITGDVDSAPASAFAGAD